MIQAGKLDRRITLLRPSSERTATGAVSETWSEEAKVWAGMMGLSIAEASRMAGAAIGREIKWRLRYRDDVQIGWRVDHLGVEYEVVSISEIGRREGLDLIARLTS